MTQNQQKLTVSEEKYPRYRWVVVGMLIFTQAVGILLTGGIGMFLPAMREELGFGMAEGGLLGSLVRAPQVIFFIPASLLLVRFNPKWVYFGGLVFTAVVSFFCGRAPGFVFLAVGYCLMGVMLITRRIPDTLLRLQWIPKKEFATVMGITMGTFAMGQSIAMIIIPFLLITLGGWRNVFSIYSLVILFLSIIWIVFAKERITPAYQEGMASRAGRSLLIGVLKRKEFLLLCLAMFGTPLPYMTTLLFLPTYLLEERGIALTAVGIIVGLMPIGGICSSFIVGFISDRIGLRRPTIWPAGLILPFLYFGLFSPIPAWALPVFTFVIGFVSYSPFPAMRTIPFELPGIKPPEVAVGQSLIQTSMMLGTVFGALAVGYLAESLGSLQTALRITCVFPLMMTVAGLLLPETGTKARPKERK